MSSHFLGDEPSIALYCGTCDSFYNHSADGYKYYYDSAKTNVVDANTLVPPKTIYDAYGHSFNLTSHMKGIKRNDSNFTVTHNLNGNVMSVTVKHKVPDEIKSKLTASQLSNNTNNQQHLHIRYYMYGKEDVPYTIKSSSISYNSTTGITTSNYSFTVRDFNKDYMDSGSISPIAVYLIPTGSGGYYRYKYTGDNLIMNTYTPEPTISTTYIGG